jgi:hypothetical protein
MICTRRQILFGCKIKKNEISKASSTYRGREEGHTGLWWENLRERNHLDDLGEDGKIILRWIFKKWDGGMDCIDLAHDRDG